MGQSSVPTVQYVPVVGLFSISPPYGVLLKYVIINSVLTLCPHNRVYPCSMSKQYDPIMKCVPTL